MKFFHSLSLKWKFILLTTFTSALSLFVACFIFAYNDLNLFKEIYLKNLENTASILAQSSRAALFFRDEKAADRILSSLKEEDQIRYAALIDSKEQLFREYGPPEYSGRKIKGNQPGSFFGINEFAFKIPIKIDEKQIGWLSLYGELDEYQAIAKNYIAFVVLTFWIIVALIIFFSIKTHRFVTHPILSLANTAKELSKEPDFSKRVASDSAGEIGILYSAFNLMLSELQKRDEELLNYKIHLEEMVKERTENLLKTNDLLVGEINEKKIIQNQLSHSLNEKEILLKEVQHRAKNNMQILSSLIWLQAQEIDDECCANRFGEFRNRVRSMALVHEKILESSNLKEISISDYIRDFSNDISNAFFKKGKEITLKTSCEDIRLDMDKTLACGLILNELVSNAFKHGFPEKKEGNIKIEAQQMQGDNICISVTDDGVGFPTGFDFQHTTSLGLDIVKSLTKEKLGGEVSLNQNGNTKILIQFSRGEKRE